MSSDYICIEITNVFVCAMLGNSGGVQVQQKRYGAGQLYPQY